MIINSFIVKTEHTAGREQKQDGGEAKALDSIHNDNVYVITNGFIKKCLK